MAPQRSCCSASASAGRKQTQRLPPRARVAFEPRSLPTCAGQPFFSFVARAAVGKSRTVSHGAGQRPAYLQLWEALCQGHDGSREGRRLKLQVVDTILFRGGRPCSWVLRTRKVLCGRSTDLGWSRCRSRGTYCGYYHRMPMGRGRCCLRYVTPHSSKLRLWY